MPLDTATAAFVRQAHASGAPSYSSMTPVEARASVAGFVEYFGRGPDLDDVRDLVVEAEGQRVPVRVLAPAGARAVIVYLHGGGWVLGTIDASDTLARILAARTRCAVVLVDYRLAPEHPYPAAVLDSWAALSWSASHLDDLAGAAVPLVVMGDSAGGNLAAVMARRARDAGLTLALQVLAYPVTDCAMDTGSYADPECQVLLPASEMAWFWGQYVADESARRDPDASPLRADDLSGVAPAVVLTAEYDVLRDEGEAYARRLADAGVPVAHRRFSGQMHGFFNMVNMLPGAEAAMDYVVSQVDAALG